MSTDFNKVLIQDDRISNLTDRIDYAVMKGAQQISVAEINATSKSPTSIVFNVVVPSLETIVDRRVMLKTTLVLKITGNVAQNKQLIAYGVRDCLGAFPMHSMMNTLSCTINNNTITSNVRDLLPALLRMLDNRELARFNNTTPVLYDSFLNYTDAFGQPNSPFQDSFSNLDQFIKPRGAFAVDFCTENVAGTAAMTHGANASAVHADNTKTVYVKVTLEEPLLLSPFLFGNPQSNNQGMYGIQNMSFNMNLGACNRIWRHVDDGKSTLSAISIESVESSLLRMSFLSAHPSQQLSPRCIVPYYDIPRYLTTGSQIAGLPARTAGAKVAPFSADIPSSTISFSQIPDKLIVFLRKPLGDQTWLDSDSFLAINSINISWDNASGVCSSYSQNDLWRMSVEAGSNQSFDEFRGYTYKKANLADETTAGVGAGSFIPTCGSVLMLDFAKHIPLVSDYYAPGSIGQFSFQIKVNASNYYSTAVTPELVVCAMNSGCFATERGTSSTYTAMLTKNDVLEASQMEPVSHSDARRMVGGGFLDTLKSVFSWIAKPENRKTIGSIARVGMDVHSGMTGKDHSSTKNILGALGGARSGGGLSGGLMSRLK